MPGPQKNTDRWDVVPRSVGSMQMRLEGGSFLQARDHSSSSDK